jgi:glycosyltransferase involved in cell wall biosynthesis
LEDSKGASERSGAPSVSVVIPAYNVAPYIGDTLTSLGAQTMPAWEAIVVDDGSRDGTGEVVTGFGDARIRLVAQANAGVSAARNRGMAEARGRTLCFLDADDWLAPDALARMLAALGEGAVAAYGAYAFVAEEAHPGAAPLWTKAGPFPEGDIVERLLVMNLFHNGGHMLIRREAAVAAGGFLQGVRFGEDWEYWLRLAVQGPIAAVPGDAPLLYVRQRSSGAYLRMATDPASFTPAMDAIFANPALLARFGGERLAALRRRTEAENAWIVGRELVRHGRAAEGRRWMRASLAAAPSLKRAAVLAAAHALPLLPRALVPQLGRYGG